jgi:hypothetical protein
MLSANMLLTGQIKVNTTAEQVTLFIEGAQVTRTKQVTIPAGDVTLLFTGLSPYLDAKSIQVGVKGQLTVTAVNRQFNYTDSLAVSGQQQQLQDELKKVEKLLKEQNAALQLIKAEQEMVKTNCTIGDKTTSPATIKEINQYYADRQQALKSKELAVDQQLAELNQRKNQLTGELEQLAGRREKPMSEIAVSVVAPVAGTATFTLTYYVKNAGWFPGYDIRSTGLTSPVSIVYKANLFQNTREEWKNVRLKLSSSNPSVDNVAPQLQTYWLDYGLAAPRYSTNIVGNTVSGRVIADSDKEPIIGASVIIPGTTIGTITDVNGNYSLTVPNGAKSLEFAFIGMVTQTKPIQSSVMNVTLKEDVQRLEEVVVTGYGSGLTGALQGRAAGITIRGRGTRSVKQLEEEPAAPLAVEQTQTQTGYEFDIQQSYTIPSNNKPVVAEIGRYEVPASYTYESTPKLDKDAFLTARITDWERLNLLEGEANIYFEETFIGKSIVNAGQLNDTLSFSLGRDRRIAVQRTKEKAFTSRQFIGSNQTQSLAWKLTVRNTRQEPVTLTLYDQLPVSRSNDITVSPEELGGGKLNDQTGIITWQLTLRPGEQREIPLRYRVKSSKYRRLVIE